MTQRSEVVPLATAARRPCPMHGIRQAVATAITICVCAILAGCGAHSSAEQSDVPDPVRRIAALLDYVAADYGQAVRDGAVLNEAEYREQVAFLEDARRLVPRLPRGADDRSGVSGDLDAEIGLLLEQVHKKATSDVVTGGCQRLRQQIIDSYGVVLAPRKSPSWESGHRLYMQSCMLCHGPTGAGDGPGAAGLQPPPRSFQDDEVMRGLSPVRAYNALTDGIAGTAMPSFEALSDSDRWSLAFFIFTLRQTDPAASRGGRLLEATGRPKLPLARLAEATDRDLMSELGASGLNGDDQAAALAQLRRSAPYEQQLDRPLARTQRLLNAAVAAYVEGDRDGAMDSVTGAYLDGFEPVEAILRSRDPDLLKRTEDGFARLREEISKEAPSGRVESATSHVRDLVSQAQTLLAEPSEPGLAFVGAMTVLFREGVEAVLLILLLLGLARRAGEASDVRMVHAGWCAAVLLGAVLWFVVGAAVPMSGASRELMEGIIALLAAGVLLYASHFVLARMDAKRRVDALRQRFTAAGPRGRRFVLLSLGFTAVFREAFEVVLFLRAILLDSPGASWAIAGGAAAGIAGCALLFVALRFTGRTLNPGQLLTASGVLLCGLAVVMTGKGIRALQEAGYVGAAPLDLPRVELFGFFPTTQTILAQALVVVAIGVIAWIGLRAPRVSVDSSGNT